MTKSWESVLNSFWGFYSRNFQRFWFFSKWCANSRNIYFIYLLILSQLYHVWRFCIILDDCIYLYIPGFLFIFIKNPPLWISFSNHSCFCDNRCKFYTYPLCSKYIHVYHSIWYIWKVINRCADLGERSYEFWKFNLSAKGLNKLSKIL